MSSSPTYTGVVWITSQASYRLSQHQSCCSRQGPRTKSNSSTLRSSEQLEHLGRDCCHDSRGGNLLLTVAPSAVLTDSGTSDTVEPEEKQLLIQTDTQKASAPNSLNISACQSLQNPLNCKHFSADILQFDSVTFRGKYLQISAKIWSEYQPLWAKAITASPPKQKNKAKLCF